MLAKSHMLSSIIVTIPMINYIPKEELLFFLIAVLLGSLTPDLDEKGSFLSRRIYVVSWLISTMTTHRGITHTVAIVFLYAILGVITTQYNDVSLIVVFGFVLGNIVHVLGDMATRSGVAIFYPFTDKKFYLLPYSMRIKTSSKFEKIIILPAMSLFVLAELYYIDVFAQFI